jgi:hypothetical protein
MDRWLRLSRFVRAIVVFPTRSPKIPEDDDVADDLRVSRHLRLCTAIPFPSLSWVNPKDNEANLEEVHDYAVQLANSAIDWYLEKKKWKKFFAKLLHYLTYLFGTLAATVPLLKIFSTQAEGEIVKWVFRGSVANPSAFSAELALVLIGLAGGFNLIDRYAGLTTGWMRYVTTAARLNRTLIAFQFAWNEVERTASLQSSSSSEARPKKPDSVTQRIELARKFCLDVLDIIGEEMAVWSDELKERVAQFSRHFPQPGRS